MCGTFLHRNTLVAQIRLNFDGEQQVQSQNFRGESMPNSKNPGDQEVTIDRRNKERRAENSPEIDDALEATEAEAKPRRKKTTSPSN